MCMIDGSNFIEKEISSIAGEEIRFHVLNATIFKKIVVQRCPFIKCVQKRGKHSEQQQYTKHFRSKLPFL